MYYGGAGTYSLNLHSIPRHIWVTECPPRLPIIWSAWFIQSIHHNFIFEPKHERLMVQWFRYRTYHSGIHVACSLILTKLLFFLCRWIRLVKISKVLSFSFRLLMEAYCNLSSSIWDKDSEFSNFQKDPLSVLVRHYEKTRITRFWGIRWVWKASFFNF